MNNVSGEGRDGGVKRKEKRDRIERKRKEKKIEIAKTGE